MVRYELQTLLRERLALTDANRGYVKTQRGVDYASLSYASPDGTVLMRVTAHPPDGQPVDLAIAAALMSTHRDPLFGATPHSRVPAQLPLPQEGPQACTVLVDEQAVDGHWAQGELGHVVVVVSLAETRLVITMLGVDAATLALESSSTDGLR